MTDILLSKIQLLPENLKMETLHYVEFLLSQYSSNLEKGIVQKRIPKFGCAKGSFKLSPDFDEPLDMFKDYMK
jgi:hypothetical protein